MGLILSLGTFCSWDVLSLGMFCLLGRFVPWDVLSLGRYVPGTFCPLGRFVPGTFCPWDVLSWDVLSWDVLYVHHHLDIVGPAGLAGYKALHVELGRVGGRSGGQGQDAALVAL